MEAGYCEIHLRVCPLDHLDLHLYGHAAFTEGEYIITDQYDDTENYPYFNDDIHLSRDCKDSCM